MKPTHSLKDCVWRLDAFLEAPQSGDFIGSGFALRGSSVDVLG